MSALNRIRIVGVGVSMAAILLAGCAGMMSTKNVNVSLSGSEEVPSVSTAAKGSGTITVTDERMVSGSVTISGLSAAAAHIHTGARGANGPVAIGLTKSSDTLWVVPSGAKFTEVQYQDFLKGNTYVNFHTAAHKGGEIRGQLQP